MQHTEIMDISVLLISQQRLWAKQYVRFVFQVYE